MNTLFRTFIRFTLFVIPFYIGMIILWGNYMPALIKRNLIYDHGTYNHMYSRIKEAKTTKNVDILFLGSSHACRGFDPRIFAAKGISTFILGSSSQTPIQTKVLLEKYLSQMNPKLIIYEVFPHTFSADGVESSLELIANDKIDSLVIRMAVQLNNIKVYNTLVYSVIRNALNLDSSYQPSLRIKDDTYIPGGFVEKDLKFNTKSTSYQNEEWKLNKNQLDTFNDIRSLIEKKRIPLIIVCTPVSSAMYSNYKNNPFFNKLVSKYPQYYDFNRILNMNDSLHFYDSHHLNQKGVVLFNEKLIEILEINKQLPCNKSFLQTS